MDSISIYIFKNKLVFLIIVAYEANILILTRKR